MKTSYIPTVQNTATPSLIEQETLTAIVTVTVATTKQSEVVLSPTASPEEANAIIYTVKDDDMLISIAEKYGASVEAIMEANGISDPNTIQVGQKIIISGATSILELPDYCHHLEDNNVERTTLGKSTQGYPIEVYKIGDGPIPVALIGGIHGGYEWNTILLAYQTIDAFVNGSEQIPDTISLYIVPSANPDGQAVIIGHSGCFSPEEASLGDASLGRFNGNNVDLNRNWDCNWKSEGIWKDRQVSAGAEPFSEIEAQLLRDFLQDRKIEVAIFWHSMAPGVFPGHCNALFQKSDDLATVYASGSGYPMYETYDSYEVTGDATDWLATKNIPAITVELATSTDPELSRNLKALREVFKWISEGE